MPCLARIQTCFLFRLTAVSLSLLTLWRKQQTEASMYLSRSLSVGFSDMKKCFDKIPKVFSELSGKVSRRVM